MSPEKAALLESLLVERYTRSDWWTGRPPTPEAEQDNDLNTARRRRDLLAAVEHHAHTA